MGDRIPTVIPSANTPTHSVKGEIILSSFIVLILVSLLFSSFSL
jgi:hypothetical protein